MSSQSHPSPELTGARLKFRASSELETRLRNFLNAPASEILRRRSGHIKLISRRVKYLDLGVGPGSTGKDIEKFEAFSRRIENKTSLHTFQLNKEVTKDEDVEDGIELNFHVDFANAQERGLIIAEPFMARPTQKPFEVYAAIPKRALATPEALAHAYELLQLSMQPVGPGSVPTSSTAPWGMNLRDAKVERVPSLEIAQ